MKNAAIIGLKELRENTEAYIKRIGRGESITVMRRATPLFRLVPVSTEDVGWEPIVDFTAIDERGVSGKDILKALRKLDG